MRDPILSSILSDFSEAYALGDLDEYRRFEHLANYCVLSRIIPESFDPEDVYVGSGPDSGIDGIAIIVNEHLVNSAEAVDDLVKSRHHLDVRFVFIQAKTTPHFDGGDISKFLLGVQAFFDPSSSLPTSDIVDRLRDLRAHIYLNSVKMVRNPLCHMFYVTTGEWKDDTTLLAIINKHKKDLEATCYFSDVQFAPLDRQRLIHVYRELKNKAIREIVFEKHTIFPAMAGVEEAYIGLLPGKEYLTLICDDDHLLQRTLFYDNVRDFQGMNVVNTAIRETVHNVEQRRYFALLNNGITVVARSVNKVGTKFKLMDYQIVNGCQTSHILYKNKEYVSDDVLIPLKLIVTQDPDITKRIIEATNSQTEVKREAFEALSPFHKDLEILYQALDVTGGHLYYERRSKQYDRESVNKRRVISLAEQLRCYLAMFLEEPHSVPRYYGEVLESYRQRLFQMEHSGRPYHTSAYALVVVKELFKAELPMRYWHFRYHLLMLVRILTAGRKVPKISGKEIIGYCEKVMSVLNDRDAALPAFSEAAEVIDRALTAMDPHARREADRRREFTAELLRLAAEQRHRGGEDAVRQRARTRGEVTRYDGDRGFGFILDAAGQKYFVHISEVVGGRLQEGDRVEFSTSHTSRGLRATDVRALS